MPTKRFDINKEQSIGQWSGGGTGNNRGSGKDTHVPIGRHTSSDIVWRVLERYGFDWTGVTQITGAVLHRKTTGQVHTGFGGSPRHISRRLLAAFSVGGGGENNWTAGSAEDWPGPSSTATNQGDSGLLADNENTWISEDITDLMGAFAPATVKRADGTPGGGNTNYGFDTRSFDETSSGRTLEFYGYRSAYPPYITLTHLTNSPPNQPVGTSPSGAVTGTVTFSGTGGDPDAGDTFASYDLQVSTDALFGTVTHWNGLGLTAGRSGWNLVNAPYGGVALPSNTQLYWHYRTYDNHGDVSKWSVAKPFTLQSAPTISAASPSTNFARIWNLDDTSVWTAGGSHAKPRVSFTYGSAAGVSMDRYRVYVDTAAGANLYDSGEVVKAASPGASVSVDIDYAVVNLTAYRWRIAVRDSAGRWSTTYGPYNFKVCWGQSIYSHNAGATTASWGVAVGLLGGSAAQIATIFQSADDAAGTTNPSGWFTQVGQVPVKAYFRMAIRLASYASGVNVTLGDVTFSYTGSGSGPSNWYVLGGSIELDQSIRRYGRYSVKLTPGGASTAFIAPYRVTTNDGVPVQPDTDYTFSVWVRTDGDISPHIVFFDIYNKDITARIATVTAPVGYSTSTSDTRSHPDGWQRLVGTFHVPTGVTSLSPIIGIYGASPPTSDKRAWIDAVRMEEGSVATNWTPGFLGDAAVIDAFGIIIDKTRGGTLRLRGSTGGARDTVELGTQGLLFGGDTQLTSAATGQMEINGTPIGGGGAAISHTSLTGVTADQHHVQSHNHGAAADGTALTPTSLTVGGSPALTNANHMTADPHTGYQLRSEKGVANGYASLSSGVLVPIAQIPTGTSGTTVALGNHSHTGLPTNYAEGTWTPGFTFATPGNLTINYTGAIRDGTYTRIGNRVLISGLLYIPFGQYTHSTASGSFLITGLPIAMAGSQQYAIGPLAMIGYTRAGYTQLTLTANPGSTSAYVRATGSGVNGLDLVAADIPSGQTMVVQITGQYYV